MSSRATFFVQECPTCGRKVRVCVEYLGMRIQCRHCRGIFVACDPETAPARSNSGLALLQRADELLATEQAPQPGHWRGDL
jgi:hypothetical protein